MSSIDVDDDASGNRPSRPSVPPAERIGAVVDRYTIVRLLGQGGMGAVYEARHATLARRFAIKFLLPDLASNPEVLRRFENEAKAAGGLEHPNLVAVTDFGRATDGSPYLVMEFLDGEDCGALLARSGPLPVSRAVNIVAQACRGLAIAHRAGIVHRDLKPENLFLADAGDGSDLIKVLDFGIAKLRPSEASVSTGTGATFGTAYYMSPEQARGAGEVDHRADVWSLGVLLYELLAGRRPFEGEQFLHVIHQILSVEARPLGALRPDLPAELTAVVARAMTKDAAHRLPSVLVFAEQLAPFAATPQSSSGPVSGPVRSPPATLALGPTMATPATNLGGLSVVPRPSGATRPPSGRRLAAGLALALAVMVAVAWWAAGGRFAPTSSAIVTPPTAPASTAAAAVAAPAAPAEVPVPAGRVVPAVSGLSGLSGQSGVAGVAGVGEVGPNKRPARSMARARRKLETKTAASAPEPSQNREPPAPRRSIDIEKSNPYDP